MLTNKNTRCNSIDMSNFSIAFNNINIETASFVPFGVAINFRTFISTPSRPASWTMTPPPVLLFSGLPAWPHKVHSTLCRHQPPSNRPEFLVRNSCTHVYHPWFITIGNNQKCSDLCTLISIWHVALFERIQNHTFDGWNELVMTLFDWLGKGGIQWYWWNSKTTVCHWSFEFRISELIIAFRLHFLTFLANTDQ